MKPSLLFAALAVLGCAPTPPPPVPAAGTPVPDDPPGVDLRPRFRELGLEVRRQHPRPTCSSFTVTGALEYALARKTGSGAALSVEFVNWAANETLGEPQDGSFFSDLWNGFAAWGICDEADLPYRGTFDAAFRPAIATLELAAPRRDVGLREHWIKEWDVNTGLTAEHHAAILRVLDDGWPVCGGFRWPKQVQWTDGLLEMAAPEDVFDGHSVLLVGYRTDPALPGGGVFLIHDSGRGAADGLLSFEFVRAYMNDALWIDFAGASD